MKRQHRHQTPLAFATGGKLPAALAALGLALAPGVHAASLYWDGTDTGADADGGDGTWDNLTTSNWDDAATAGSDVQWDSANNDTAVFGATAGTVTIDTGGVTAGGLQFDTNNYVIDGDTLTLGSTGDIANGGTTIIESVIGGTVGVTKTGGGRLELRNVANTFSGDIAVNDGVLRIGQEINNGTLAAVQLGGGDFTDNISIAAGSTFEFWSFSSQEFSGVISGDGNLYIAMRPTVTLSGDNTYTGQTELRPRYNGNNPTIVVSSFNSVVGGTASSSLGAPTTVANGTIIVGNSGTQGGGQITYVGPGETTDRVLQITTNGNATKTLLTNGAGPLRFTSAMTRGGGSQTNGLSLRGSGDGILDEGIPIILNNLTKSDAGKWTLDGPSKYWNQTTLSGGTLSISSPISDGSFYFANDGSFSTVGGSPVVTVSDATGLEPGMVVRTERLPNNEGTIVSIDYGANELTLDVNSTQTRSDRDATIGFPGGLGISTAAASNLRWANSATLQYTGPDDGTNRGFTIDNGRTATWDITNSATNLEVSGDTTTTSGNLVKIGDGTLTLSGAQAYTGATTVSAGTLGLVGGSQASAITVATGASLGFTLGSPTTSTASVDLTNGTVKITGAVDNASDYKLMTATSFTGSPTLDSAITDYQLELRAGGTELWLAYTGVVSDPYVTWIALFPGVGGMTAKTDDPDKDGKDNNFEFAFNGDPSDPSNNGLIASLVQDTDTANGDELTMVAAVRDGATFADAGSPVTQTATVDGVVYTIRGTLDLVTVPGSDVSHAAGPADTAPGTGLPTLAGTDWEYHTFKLDASEPVGAAGGEAVGFLQAVADVEPE